LCPASPGADAIGVNGPAAQGITKVFLAVNSTASRSSADTASWAAGSWKAIGQTTLTGAADESGRRVSNLAAEGISEIIDQPAGPDITGELEAFHTAARTAVRAVAQDNPGQ
jgi:hypothetical protein